MADYKFDGKELRCRGAKVGTLDGKYIRDEHGSKVGEIDGKYIRNSSGSKIGEFDGSTVRDGSGSRIGEFTEIKKDIDGVGGVSLTAMWLIFVR